MGKGTLGNRRLPDKGAFPLPEGGARWDKGEKVFPGTVWGPGAGFTEKLWIPCHWKYSRPD